MFSGIVQGIGIVRSLEDRPGIRTIVVDLGEIARGVTLGASVAIAGVCLTVVAEKGGLVTFDAMQETLEKTTLGTVAVGSVVNAERSAHVGDEIGGHRVSGHVSTTASIKKRDDVGGTSILRFSVDAKWMEYILPKGFIALDGCSLTIVDVGPDWFTVHLIPETLERTTFGRRAAGDRVNLEIDPETQVIVETVKRYLAAKQ